MEERVEDRGEKSWRKGVGTRWRWGAERDRRERNGMERSLERK